MTHEEFASLIARGPVLLDGATGSQLRAKGMPVGVCTELWAYEHPEVIVGLQRAYVDAGSDIIYAPTFSANRIGLASHGIADRLEDLNAGLVALAEKAPAFKAVIDVDDPRFLAPGDMPARIQAYCREKGQPVPEGRGEISRVIYESLALKYRWAIERLEQDLLKKHIDVLHIVGGGSKNVMLNRMTASAIGRPVIAGPGEGTVIGNLLVQAMALGAVDSVAALRQVVSRSFENVTYQPEGDPAAWDAPYARLLALMG